MSMERRVGELERRVRERAPERRGDGAARAYMSGFLRRYAAAKQRGAITEELQAEADAVRAALERRRGAETRGEGLT